MASTRDRWAEQLAALDGSDSSRTTKRPITVERIVTEAFRIVAAEGFDALTMRRVAAALHTGPASLYAHVRNKAELDELLLGAICSRVMLPTPDAAHWKEQLLDVCRQLRDGYLRYPGVSRTAFGTVTANLDVLRLSEGLLAILIAAEVDARTAAWTIDATFLYVSAYCLELAPAALQASPPKHSRTRDGAIADAADPRIRDRAELLDRFSMLPAALFPYTRAHAAELTSGEGHERFDFTLRLLLGGLPASAAPSPHTAPDDTL